MRKSRSTQTRPRLGFVGLMLGRNPGYVTSQGQILCDLFEQGGYEVFGVSSVINRYLRLADIVFALIRKSRKTDIIVLDVFGGLSFVVADIASLVARAVRYRMIMHVHGGSIPELMARFPRWTRRVLSRANGLVAPSAFLARALTRHGLKTQIIPNVIDISQYVYRQRRNVRPRMFWMRSFHPIYNPLLAVRVLARVREIAPEASLVLAGQDKGQELATRKLADELGLGQAARFVGMLDAAGKTREGGAADIFVNTSCMDNMPVALLEACAMGLPVVTTSVGGIPDLLTDGHTGLLVSLETDEAITQAVERLLTDDALAERLSSNGRKLAERCAWENVRPQWEQLFQGLLRDGADSR